MSSVRDEEEPAELDAGALEVSVSIGGHDVSSYVSGLRLYRRVEGIPRTTFQVSAPISESTWDWQGEVIVNFSSNSTRDQVFTGLVTSACPRVDRSGFVDFDVECHGAVQYMSEPIGFPAVARMPEVDELHWILRHAGWPDDRLDLEGLDTELPSETFTVFAAVDGILVSSKLSVGGVDLVPPHHATLPDVRLHDETRELVALLTGSTAIAITTVTCQRTFDAESSALEAIDLGLAWLSSRAHDGSAALGRAARRFNRDVTYINPVRSHGVLVHGNSTERFAIRGSTEASPPIDPVAAVPAWSAPPLPPTLPRADELAILAWHRARLGLVAEQRVQALWDAMEYYSASAKVPGLFDGELIDSLVDHYAIFALTPEQRTKVDFALRNLNSPSLMVRLKTAASDDGIILGEADLLLLRRLRKSRNAASHGRSNTSTRDEDIQHGLSLVARLLAARSISIQASTATQGAGK